MVKLESWESPGGILQLQVPPPPFSFLLVKSQEVYINEKKNGENERKGRELESYGARSSGVAVWCDQSRQREKRDFKKTYYCKLYERI